MARAPGRPTSLEYIEPASDTTKSYTLQQPGIDVIWERFQAKLEPLRQDLNKALGNEQVALVHGDLGYGTDVLVRVHSECLTGDVLGSQRCDCGPQLQASMAAVTEHGAGVIVYLRGHEGRGIGLLAKLRAYALQDDGQDTVDANLALGLPIDARHYADGAQILRDLGVSSVRLLTNNPDKVAALERFGVAVTERVPLAINPTEDNLRYLQTKAERMGHHLPDLVEIEEKAADMEESTR